MLDRDPISIGQLSGLAGCRKRPGPRDQDLQALINTTFDILCSVFTLLCPKSWRNGSREVRMTILGRMAYTRRG